MLIVLVVINIVLVGVVIFQNYSNSQQAKADDSQKEKGNYQLLGVMAEQNERQLARFGEFERVVRHELMQVSDRVDRQLVQLDRKVNERLDQSFERTNETFQNILVRLAKIDEAQRHIENLSTDIVSLQNLLSDKKSRGTFGEVQLYQILSAVFGDKNERVYETQVGLSNGTVVDAMLFAPQPLGNLAIDSKFPLENYQRMMDKDLSEVERKAAEKQFKADMRKHVDDIANKYILPNETSDQAILFLPAEAIFAEINAYHSDLVAYSQNKRVWLVSPTTFMSTLTTIQVILNNLERDQHALIIQQELNKLGAEFKRYKERWDKLSKHIDTVSKDVKDIHITTEKIGTRFDSISKVELEAIESNTLTR